MLVKAPIGSPKNIPPKQLMTVSCLPGFEWVHLRVGLLEADMAEAFGGGRRTRFLEHPRREVDSEGGTGGAMRPALMVDAPVPQPMSSTALSSRRSSASNRASWNRGEVAW